MADLHSLSAQVIAFRDERDWKQFHNAKDVSISLLLEASELLEHFQWKDAQQTERTALEKRAEIGAELADVLYYTLLLAHDLNIDLADALQSKLQVNAAKYPVDKARGSNKKYTDL